MLIYEIRIPNIEYRNPAFAKASADRQISIAVPREARRARWGFEYRASCFEFLTPMFSKNAHLKRNTLSKEIDLAPTRDGFGIGVVEAGKKNDQVVVLCADLADSTRAAKFKDAFPSRFI